ncbi:MAG: hypothetical protein RMX96_23765, partial [Nostoc sp. ChiSLP02]|nr:hypothetical protein [Nostoc sp. ChiSLP02]
FFSFSQYIICLICQCVSPKAIKINRKTGPRVSVSRTSVSVVGTIQLCVLQKQMGNLKEDDGFWPR